MHVEAGSVEEWGAAGDLEWSAPAPPLEVMRVCWLGGGRVSQVVPVQTLSGFTSGRHGTQAMEAVRPSIDRYLLALLRARPPSERQGRTDICSAAIADGLGLSDPRVREILRGSMWIGPRHPGPHRLTSTL